LVKWSWLFIRLSGRVVASVLLIASYDRLLPTRRRSCRRHKPASKRQPLLSHQFAVVFEVRAGRLDTLCYQAPRQRPSLIQFDKALAVLLWGASLSPPQALSAKRILWQVFQAAASACPWRMPAWPHRNTRENCRGLAGGVEVRAGGSVLVSQR
jgi:hypothetical protein